MAQGDFSKGETAQGQLNAAKGHGPAHPRSQSGNLAQCGALSFGSGMVPSIRHRHIVTQSVCASTSTGLQIGGLGVVVCTRLCRNPAGRASAGYVRRPPRSEARLGQFLAAHVGIGVLVAQPTCGTVPAGGTVRDRCRGAGEETRPPRPASATGITSSSSTTAASAAFVSGTTRPRRPLLPGGRNGHRRAPPLAGRVRPSSDNSPTTA